MPTSAAKSRGTLDAQLNTTPAKDVFNSLTFWFARCLAAVIFL